MYADDTCISLKTDNLPDVNEALNMDLEALHAWLNGNRLSLNVAKTQSMTIATKHKRAALENQNEQLHLQIRNENMEVLQCTKYLGGHIDNSLNWKKQIQDTSKKVSRSIGMLKHAKRYLPFMHLKLSILMSLTLISVTDVLCESIWCYRNQLQKLQNRAARIITGINYDAPSKPLL